MLALSSGVLFTVNNFVLNQTEDSLGDVVLVRTVVQLLVYFTVMLVKGESLLPPGTGARICVVVQGK